MGGVPAKRHSKSKVGRRRAHLALRPKTFSRCANCGAAVLPHHACMVCGYYRGRAVVKIKTKKEKKKK